MLVELDSFDGYDPYYSSASARTPESEDPLYQAIFSNANNATWGFSKKATLDQNHTALEKRTAAIFADKPGRIKSMDAGGSVVGELKIEWGGDKTTVSVGGKAEAHDNDGNFGEVKFEVKNDDTGSVTFSGGHKEGGEKDK